MGDARIPWLAEAADRLRFYHVEIDAAMRRLARGEEFTDEHVVALIEVMCACDKIKTDVIRHLSEQRQRRASDHHRQLESIRRIASRNGHGSNGTLLTMPKY